MKFVTSYRLLYWQSIIGNPTKRWTNDSHQRPMPIFAPAIISFVQTLKTWNTPLCRTEFPPLLNMQTARRAEIFCGNPPPPEGCQSTGGAIDGVVSVTHSATRWKPKLIFTIPHCIPTSWDITYKKIGGIFTPQINLRLNKQLQSKQC